ncbi:O-antigen ligase family protein [Rhodopseudomonas palustris]|uniref:O-antigen ligase family protein n=1 Tax=Rhodopseudomonas palustris TaxID=1076 RepID=UPI0021F3B2E4|nr:O-antigen ligase family protein [Rhodopseudomonas palustris]
MAVAILSSWHVIFRHQRHPAILVLAASAALIGWGALVVVVIAMKGTINSEFLARLLLISDRLTILWSSLRLMFDSPLIGVGGILLDYQVGHLGAASFHNSYLEVAVRTGVLGLSIYLPMILLPLFLLRWSDRLVPIILFVLVGSMFQNLLRHPHIAIVFSVLIAWAGLRDRSPFQAGRAV